MFRRAAALREGVLRLNALLAFAMLGSAVVVAAVPESAPTWQQGSAAAGMLGVLLANQADQAVVSALYVGGPAHRAGLRCGDRILAINGQPVNSTNELINRLNQLSAGQRVDLLVDCGGWTHRFLVTLESRDVVANYPTIQPPAPAPVERPRKYGFYGRGYISGQRALDICDPYRRALYTNFGN